MVVTVPASCKNLNTMLSCAGVITQVAHALREDSAMVAAAEAVALRHGRRLLPRAVQQRRAAKVRGFLRVSEEIGAAGAGTALVLVAKAEAVREAEELLFRAVRFLRSAIPQGIQTFYEILRSVEVARALGTVFFSTP